MIITGKLHNPTIISAPNVQPEPGADDPIYFTRGQSISIMFKFPSGTKRLLFSVSQRIFDKEALFEQVIFPPKDEVGVAEFVIPDEKTFSWCAGLYHWTVFQLRGDGSKDVWLPHHKGTFNLVDSPATRTLTSDEGP